MGLCVEIFCIKCFSYCVIDRRKQLSTTVLPYEYEVYATYVTTGNLEDLKLHQLIDKVNSDLRVSKNRELYVMTPQDAYELLEVIVLISDMKDRFVIIRLFYIKKMFLKKRHLF